jgi:CubicO group peptidase (beta-lactamase class C family)
MNRKPSAPAWLRAMIAAVLMPHGLTSAAAQVPDTQNAGAGSLVALWQSETILKPLVHGVLTIDGRLTPWRAHIQGQRGRVTHNRDTVTCVFPSGAGEFRGVFENDHQVIRGHWIQPAVQPFGQYATPVLLARVTSSAWRGEVRPLEARMTFYLSIQPAKDGTIEAFIRNPEANFFADRSYKVRLTNNRLVLEHPSVPEEGTYESERDELLIPLLFGYGPLTFTRRRDATAPGFFAGDSAADTLYEYHPPLPESDGWTVAPLGDVGIDRSLVERFVQRIKSSSPGPDNPLNIHSLLVARHGRLVLETYFHGFDGEHLHDTRSASKTITSVLIGVAHDRGFPIAATTTIASLLARDQRPRNWDERKASITVADLLNMTSGLDADDADPSSPGREGHLWEQRETTDLCRFMYDLPMARAPGGNQPIYASGNTNLAGCAVRAATGRWLPELFDEYLARPLQISRYAMNLMPNGEAYAGGGMYMRPRDQLKVGQVFLSNGRWNGQSVVSREWVRRSTAARAGDMKSRHDLDIAHGYGMGWHFRSASVGGRTVPYYWMQGNGGQFVIVVPALDMVIGFTGGDIAQPRKYERWEIVEVPKTILAAVMR